jgi:hypothetical protein
VTDPVTLTGADGVPYLAVDVQPDIAENVFSIGESELNGPDLLARNDTDPGLWQNVVCDVQTVALRRGAADVRGLLTQTEAGTVTVIVSDTTRAFDPTVSSDFIHKGTPLRIRAWGTDDLGDPWETVLWTGEVDALTAAYHPDDPPTVTVTGVDLIGVLTAWEAEGRATLVGAGDTLRGRVNRVLAEVDRGSVATGSDTTFTATLAPIPIARPWDEISAGVLAELGRVWVTRDNLLAVRARGTDLTGPVRGTLSDIHGETEVGPHCCMSDAAVAYGWEQAGNRVLAGRRMLDGEDPDDAVLARQDLVSSQARYGVGVVREDTLDLETDGQLTPWAQAVIASHGRPRLRVNTVTPAPSQHDLASALEAWPAVLGTDLGDRWLFLYRPTFGPAVRRTVGILGIELQLTPDEWRVTWATGEAPTA